jgi:TPR repeat protein
VCQHTWPHVRPPPPQHTQAAKLGNVSALVVRARLLDAAGCPDEAMRCWRRAAKAGHLEGQLLYGLALYRGTAGVAPDAEDAHLWLSKALKQVCEGG